MPTQLSKDLPKGDAGGGRGALTNARQTPAVLQILVRNGLNCYIVAWVAI